MAIYYYDISGSSTSETSKQLLSTEILCDDMFLVSQQTLSSVDPNRQFVWHGQVLKNGYSSKSAKYGVLSSDLFNTLCSEFGFKSMAWESSADYSLYNHVHNYSKAQASFTIQKADDGTFYYVDEDGRRQTLMSSDVSAIATLRIDDKHTTLYAPKVSIYKQPKPYLGQLKFLALTSLPPIDEITEDFNGWVYPDGRAVSRVRFAQAFAYFGEDYGAGDGETTFNIPAISDFIKAVQPTASNLNTSLTRSVPAAEVLKSHKHEATDLGMSGTVECTTKFKAVNNTYTGDSCHGTNSTSGAHDQRYDMWFKISNITIAGDPKTGSASNTKTTHPAYNFLPVLMYIGTE